MKARAPGLAVRVAELEVRCARQAEELLCLRSTLADALRRLNALEGRAPSAQVTQRNGGYTGSSGTPTRELRLRQPAYRETAKRTSSYGSSASSLPQRRGPQHQSTGSLQSDSPASSSSLSPAPSPSPRATPAPPPSHQYRYLQLANKDRNILQDIDYATHGTENRCIFLVVIFSIRPRLRLYTNPFGQKSFFMKVCSAEDRDGCLYENGKDGLYEDAKCNLYEDEEYGLYEDGISAIYLDKVGGLYDDGEGGLYADEEGGLYEDGESGLYADGEGGLYADGEGGLYADGECAPYKNRKSALYKR
ncbi:hypothetical protein ACJJTC_016865 [Scirpophaga incertulas]